MRRSSGFKVNGTPAYGSDGMFARGYGIWIGGGLNAAAAIWLVVAWIGYGEAGWWMAGPLALFVFGDLLVMISVLMKAAQRRGRGE